MQADVSLGGLVVQAGVGAVIVLQGVIMSRISGLEKSFREVAKSVISHDVTLFGETRQNGLNGAMKEAQADIEELRGERRQQTRRDSDRK